MSQVKRGATLELQVEEFGEKGASFSKLDDLEIRIPGAVPGDRVLALITQVRRKKGFAVGRLERLLEPSDLRTTPECRYVGFCGGCPWQHVEYPAQLAAKRDRVESAFRDHGMTVSAHPTIGSERIFYYRNKMEFSFSARRWLTPDEVASDEAYDTDFALGLHAPGHFDKVIDLEVCYLQSELSHRIVNAIRAYAKEQGWEPWSIRESTGYLRHLVVRQGEHTGDLMLNLVTSRYEPEAMERLGAHLQESFPQVTTFVNTINTGVAQVSYGEEAYTIFGPGSIHDTIGPYRFRIAPESFFQTNTLQAERLYEITREFAELQPTDLLYDLYCGAGTISLYMSSHVRRVVGIELVEAAVADARHNAAVNGVENCTFFAGDMRHLFTDDFIRQHGEPDVLITDPPRAGMHPDVVAQIAKLRPERLVYVSCNPQTQARDITLLTDLYEIERIQPVDLFPHTHHIESVTKLRRIGRR